ncbi:MAG TPA: ribose-phosphate pyrophosphokinase [Egibacteraceae bacterium]|nr:ribose-phosphate pyrophosphokinase [Egibacteraceae bacterium]
MDVKVVPGSANRPLASALADMLGGGLTAVEVDQFPDGELRVTVSSDLRGDDVYLLQSTGPPVNEHLVELLLLADACRRAGAAQLTAVVPYLCYARQDRRTEPGEPVSVRVVGDLLAASGVDRVLVVDPHTPNLEAIFGIPVEIATAVPTLVDALRDELSAEAVVVAPDLGAVKLARAYASHLDRPVAIISKTRLSGKQVRAGQVIGDVAGCSPVIVDDMISTGGTIEAAVGALGEAGAAGGTVVAATHGVLTGEAGKVLGGLELRRLLVTDSVPPPSDLPPRTRTVTTAKLLAEAIRRLHEARALDELQALG